MISEEQDVSLTDIGQKENLQRRKLPKLMACMTKRSVDNLRNKILFSVDALDAKGVRRRKLPLFQCLILELKETGYSESSNFLQNLLYDNALLVAEDDIGIIVDLTKADEFLEDICRKLQAAEKFREANNTKKECLVFLNLAQLYEEKGKGILWLAEKFYLVAIAVGSRYLLDGGRLKGICKYYHAKFILDKFAGADPDEAFQILTEVRDCSIGKLYPIRSSAGLAIYIAEVAKAYGPCAMRDPSSNACLTIKNLGFPNSLRILTWPLYEPTEDGEEVPLDTLFEACALQLWRVLVSKAKSVRAKDPAKAERLARLAERRAKDAGDTAKTAEAIIEVGICQLMMNNLNNAFKTFERAMVINQKANNVLGICVTKMHLAAVLQRLGDHEQAAKLLTEMGALAMENGLRRHLGQALHLLGELHLRRERPELGTQHLAEAFTCFMGFMNYDTGDANPKSLMNLHAHCSSIEGIKNIFSAKNDDQVYYEEAEQSRLMMAISAGQEVMPSYFKLIEESRTCAVARIKCIEWKLGKMFWWIKKKHDDLVPCMCPVHNRTPLDVLQSHLLKVLGSVSHTLGPENTNQPGTLHGVADSVQDLTTLQTSLFFKSMEQAGAGSKLITSKPELTADHDTTHATGNNGTTDGPKDEAK